MKRSQYLGVYHNKDETYPYRVAIKRFIYDKGVNTTTTEYINKGTFKTEESAAFAYNVYAIYEFGPNAVINNVELTPMIEVELETIARIQPDFITVVMRATELAETFKDKIRLQEDLQ